MDEFLDIPVVDTSQEEARLTKLIEAIVGLAHTKEWQTINELHFSEEEHRIERLILNEAKKSLISDKDLYRLQGEMIWAMRYADIGKWVTVLTNKLNKLKHGK